MVWRWSKTAATNATADVTINWAEGMPPSAVNDSSRAEMARVAQWRDDISGAITTAGTSTNYTLTSNQGFSSLSDLNNAMIAFVPHVTNAVSCTLSVDGISGCYVRTATNTYMPEGVLVAGTPYVATFKSATNEFILHNMTSQYYVPIGSAIPYFAGTAPNSAFAMPYGQAISRTNYASLYALFGGQYGSGDGSTTFNLPDLRGRIIGAVDNMGGTTANRLLNGSLAGSRHSLGGTGGTDTITLTNAQMPTHSHGGGTGAMNQKQTHSHTYTAPGGTFVVNVGSGSPASFTNPPGGLSNTSTIDLDHGHPIANDGGSTAHDNLQPTILCNYIMRII